MTRAAGVSWRALRVALALWYLVGLEKVRTIKLTGKARDRFALSAEAGRVGLAALERAGLVAVERPPGCCPQVTILEAKDQP